MSLIFPIVRNKIEPVPIKDESDEENQIIDSKKKSQHTKKMNIDMMQADVE